ncbi:MAG: type II toxin-antitoxin system HipA family toxin [Kiloniellales bacterium]
MSRLVALLDGREAGVVRQAKGRLSFRYEDSWRDASGAYPLSLSLPLAAREHGHAAIDAYLWGLLPDNELILGRWAKRFQVSARNPFALIGKVGEDCAGAAQFATPDRLDSLKGQGDGDIAWLSEAEIAKRLRALQADAAAWRMPRDTGQFSLPGAQPKTALYFDGQRWGVPSGRAPTTHILKPPTGDLDGHVENEHLCLALARALGLPAASSELRSFEDVTAIVVERYDRVRAPANASRLHRVHQEDFCQALGRLPGAKYQSDGGPGPREIVELLRAVTFTGEARRKTGGRPAADEDVATFVDALIFNWLIGGTDAHAKNYALLIGGGGLVRLAPLYDVASILGYPDIDTHKAKLAMKIGGQYRLRRIGLPEWLKLARELRLDAEETIERIRELAEALPDKLATETANAKEAGPSHPLIPRLADAMIERAKDCSRRL